MHVKIENHIDYKVKKILTLRQSWNKLEYLVHWHGYDINEYTLEPTENLVNDSEKVQEFHQRCLYKPKSYSKL